MIIDNRTTGRWLRDVASDVFSLLLNPGERTWSRRYTIDVLAAQRDRAFKRAEEAEAALSKAKDEIANLRIQWWNEDLVAAWKEIDRTRAILAKLAFKPSDPLPRPVTPEQVRVTSAMTEADLERLAMLSGVSFEELAERRELAERQRRAAARAMGGMMPRSVTTNAEPNHADQRGRK